MTQKNPNPKTGKRNLITDLDGILIGNAQDTTIATGVTVLLPTPRATASCDMRGGAPGTRETDALQPETLVDAVDAIFLSGGSSYGLEAGSAIASWLGAKGRGFALTDAENAPRSPVVPGAILYDLANGGDKKWGETPPYARLGKEACEKASRDFALGNIGAGYGATCGALKGGLGSASLICADGLQVGALMAVNAFGSAVSPETGRLWAESVAEGDEMGGAGAGAASAMRGGGGDIFAGTKAAGAFPGANTTIGVVAVNAALSVAEAKRVAIMAQDGLARALRPVHTPLDGDMIFVIATGRWDMGDAMRSLSLARIGTLAADVVVRAVGRGVYEAESLGGVLCYRESLKDC